ncbi:MAG: hypothetical protein LAP85_26495 [Acidobacteriia bacterium]|nr:hypothetical protein [Terriglobia bacterium]
MKTCLLGCCILATSCLLLVGPTGAGPKDFWETKPYTQWTVKEAEKLLLKDSPWTRTHRHEGYHTGRLVGVKGNARYEGGYWVPEARIIINWFAKPIREATARQLVLRNPNALKARIDEILNRDPRFVEVLVTDLPQARGNWAKGGAEEFASFRKSAYLSTKSAGKIPLSNIVMNQGWGDALIMQFARQINGIAIVNENDKEVTLFIKIDWDDHRFIFNLKEMRVKGGLEI